MTPAEILSKNMRRASSITLREEEHRLLLLEEWAELSAEAIAAKRKSPSPLFVLNELRRVVDKSLQKGSQEANAFFSQLSLVDSARFCRMLSEKLSLSHLGESKRIASPTVCYVKTVQAEGAFSLLTEHCRDARVFYISNAEEGFSAVDGERADFCIMPYETADGVRLLQTERLAERYDLHLSALFATPDPQTEERVLFALYAKEAFPFVQTEKATAELTLAGGEELAAYASELLSVFSALSLRALRFSCAPDAHGRMRARFSIEGERYEPLWLFLSLFCEATVKLDVFPILS